MTRRGPSRRRLSGSLRRRQGSARRADPFGASTPPRTTRVVGAPADGLDRASREPTTRFCVTALLSDPASNADDVGAGHPAASNGAAISIARCRDLLGDEGCALSDEEIELVRRRADAMAHILVDIFLQNLSTRE